MLFYHISSEWVVVMQFGLKMCIKCPSLNFSMLHFDVIWKKWPLTATVSVVNISYSDCSTLWCGVFCILMDYWNPVFRWWVKVIWFAFYNHTLVIWMELFIICQISERLYSILFDTIIHFQPLCLLAVVFPRVGVLAWFSLAFTYCLWGTLYYIKTVYNTINKMKMTFRWMIDNDTANSAIKTDTSWCQVTLPPEKKQAASSEIVNKNV